ncbi:hypothetical protein VTP01DRAFT_5124 [Rhizomucor pusillus]|uniref:uncharacterized protein n=1 Tax=Rhizomucor pusillus TaxID=4840 RepID=UPI003743DE56
MGRLDPIRQSATSTCIQEHRLILSYAAMAVGPSSFWARMSWGGNHLKLILVDSDAYTLAVDAKAPSNSPERIAAMDQESEQAREWRCLCTNKVEFVLVTIDVGLSQKWNPRRKHARCPRSGLSTLPVNYVIDDYPSAVMEQLMERLLQTFEELKVFNSTVYDFVRTQCNLSLKKVRFQSVDRNSEERIQEHLDWVRKWQGTDMDFRTNCVRLPIDL